MHTGGNTSFFFPKVGLAPAKAACGSHFSMSNKARCPKKGKAEKSTALLSFEKKDARSIGRAVSA
jgi:hypothetical protein